MPGEKLKITNGGLVFYRYNLSVGSLEETI